ncbi:MAG: glycosyltransferase [Candidatus Delongbacteria bacterium]|nr:glycosyltransferase [Candidatus Delongbacteria bacterium]
MIHYPVGRSGHLKRLWNCLKTRPIRIIQLQYPTAVFSGYRLILSLLIIRLRFHDIRIVTTIHEILPYLMTSWRRRIRFSGYFLRLFLLILISDRLISTNRQESEWLKRYHSKVRVIPIGGMTPISSGNPIIPAMPERYAVFFGNIHSGKRLDLIIEAWAALKSADDYWVICYGNQETRLLQQLDHQIERLGIKKQILFYHGLDNDTILKILQGSRGVILPYQGGITPRSMVLQTVLAGRRPILAEVGPQTPFWLKQILPLTYSLPCPSTAITGKIRRMMDSESESTSDTSRMEVIRRYFSWPSIAAKYFNLYCEIMRFPDSCR